MGGKKAMLHAAHIKQNKQTGREMGGKVSLQKSYKMTSGHFVFPFPFVFCFFFFWLSFSILALFWFSFLAELIGIVLPKHKQASRADSAAVLSAGGVAGLHIRCVGRQKRSSITYTQIK